MFCVFTQILLKSRPISFPIKELFMVIKSELFTLSKGSFMNSFKPIKHVNKLYLIDYLYTEETRKAIKQRRYITYRLCIKFVSECYLHFTRIQI